MCRYEEEEVEELAIYRWGDIIGINLNVAENGAVMASGVL